MPGMAVVDLAQPASTGPTAGGAVVAAGEEEQEAGGAW